MENRIHLALIATYPKMANLFMEYAGQIDNVETSNVHADFERAVSAAKEMEARTDLILSRGGTADWIRKAVEIPVITIPITPFDLSKIIHRLPKEIKRVAFIHYQKNLFDVQEIEEMYGVQIQEYLFQNRKDIEDAIEDARRRGIHTIIGGEVAASIAEKVGMHGIEISAGKEAVSRAVDEAVQIVNEKRKERIKASQLKAAFESIVEGIVVTDVNKRIVICNNAAQKIFGRRYQAGDLAGADVCSDKWSSVFRTQQKENDYVKKIGDKIYTIAHLPVFREGGFIGIVSRYEDITKVQKLEQRIRNEIHKSGFVARYRMEDVLTQNKKMEMIKQRAAIYAETDSAILIEGESGTGKEMFAQSIHNASKRANGPFVAVNCAAIPENLLESELFGYDPGAFTGAKKEGKPGLFELAHNGTLFLDEIGEISKMLQSRLLRVLQEKEIMRVGGNRIIPVDVRIISATNKHLRENIISGDFREDLYYRLNVLNITIPTLRERKEDIIPLSMSFAKRIDPEMTEEMMERAFKLLMNYGWPGNIRELQNTIERYCVIHKIVGEDILQMGTIEDLLGFPEVSLAEPESDAMTVKIPMQGNLHEIMEAAEKVVVEKCLEECGNNQQLAAKRLGIGRTTLWRKINPGKK